MENKGLTYYLKILTLCALSWTAGSLVGRVLAPPLHSYYHSIITDNKPKKMNKHKKVHLFQSPAPHAHRIKRLNDLDKKIEELDNKRIKLSIELFEGRVPDTSQYMKTIGPLDSLREKLYEERERLEKEEKKLISNDNYGVI